MIAAEYGSLLRQSGYISAPDLSPKSQKLQRKTAGVGDKERREGGTTGVGRGGITTETEERKPSSKSLN